MKSFNFFKSKFFIYLASIPLVYLLLASIVFYAIIFPMEKDMLVDTVMHIQTMKLDRSLNNVDKGINYLLIYRRLKDKNGLNALVNRLKLYIVKTDDEFKILNEMVSGHKLEISHLLPGYDKIIYSWERINRPELLKIVNNKNLVSINSDFVKKVARETNELNRNYYTALSFDEIKHQMDDLKEIYAKYNLLFLIGSSFIFIILIFLLTLLYKRGEILRENEERYRMMFGQNYFPMLLVDVDTGVIKDASKGAFNFYGYGKDELIGMNISEINRETPIEEQKVFRHKVEKGEVNFALFQHSLKNGETRFIEYYPTPFIIGGKRYVMGIIHDITRRKRLQDKLEESEKLFSALSEHSLSGIVMHDESIIYYANPFFYKTFGYTKKELASFYFWDFFAEDFKAKIEQSILSLIKTKEIDKLDSFVAKAVPKDGRDLWLLINMAKVVHNGEPACITNFTDITEIKKYEDEISSEKEKFERLSFIDPLTGIYNRRKFEEILSTAVSLSHRYKRPLSVMMFDIDYFKKVNDTYGHEAGDIVLKELTKYVKSFIRSTDTFARVGGEEFMIICPETDLSEAREFAERIRASIEMETFPIVPSVTLSFGVAVLGGDDSPIDLTNKADKAMYIAKSSGRNRVEAFGS